MPPTRIGNYRVIASLGRGGMADVFLAARTGPVNFTKLVVIKQLRSDHAQQADAPRYRALLLDEARLAARMHHPNIVQTFEVMDDAGEPYITMEYLEGQSLNRVVHAVRRHATTLPREYALGVVGDVLAALAYAHDLADFDGTPLHIVHRDVSPQNIFWTYDGEVKLMDFGIAKFAQASTETRTGLIKGKLGYMAPEQARGEQLDPRADVFAVGVVMWELLSGGRLFKADSDAATIHRVLFEPLPPLPADIDPAIAAICSRALARERTDRYPDAVTMHADIDHVLGRHRPRREQLAGFIRGHFAKQRVEVKETIRAAMSRTDAPLADITAATERDLAQSFAPPLPQEDIATRTLESATVPPQPRPSRPPELMSPPPPARRRALIGGAIALCGVAATAVTVTMCVRGPRNAPRTAATASSTQPAAAATTAPARPAVTVPAEPAPALVVCGSKTMGSELAPALIEAFLRKQGATAIERRATGPDDSRLVTTVADQPIAIALTTHSTASGFEQLRDGTCDASLASRAINDDEAAQLATTAGGDVRRPATEHVVALDGIAVIVHPNNPVRALDRAEVHDVFAGRATDWSQVGTGAGPIAVLARDESGTADVFKAVVLGDDPLAPTAKQVAASDALADAVATDPAAIGFIGLVYIRSAKAIAVSDGGTRPMLPTPFTVTTEDYLLSRRFYLYTMPRPRTPLVTELVSFVTSSAGQEVVRGAGFVDLAAILHDGEPCDARCPSGYAAATAHAQRVSINFRFRAGSDDLDSRATLDLDRLVDVMRSHPGAKLMLLGFSDAARDHATAIKRSREHARIVARELESRGVRAALVDGFGDALPVVSNATDAGRERNRRVEVWLRGS